MFYIIRNRASRIHRGSEAQTPIGSVNSNELTILPTTSPQSYTSFKFDSSPPKHNQSSSSFKNSTDASEDEGSFVVGSRKSSQQWDNSHDAVETLTGAVHLEYDAIRIPRQDTNEDEQGIFIRSIFQFSLMIFSEAKIDFFIGEYQNNEKDE